jgi:hypothetical protein
VLIELAGTHLAPGGLLMFCSGSCPFSLLPSCLPIMPPDTVQITGNLGHHWGPNGGLPQGNGLECMPGHLE